MIEHAHYDEAQIAAAADTLAAEQAWLLDQANSRGAQARMLRAVLKPAYVAMACEINRGSQPDEVMHAIAATFANIALTWASTFGASPPTNDMLKRLEALSDCFADSITMMLRNQNVGGRTLSVAPMKGGRA